MRHLASLFDLGPDEVRRVLALSAHLKQRLAAGEREPWLPGRTLVMLFEKPSLRTRLSFELAMNQLGGSATFLSTHDAGLKGRESLEDVARVIGSYADAVAMRTFSQSLIDDFTLHAGRPIVNGLSDDRHPCQALTDTLTIR